MLKKNDIDLHKSKKESMNDYKKLFLYFLDDLKILFTYTYKIDK